MASCEDDGEIMTQSDLTSHWYIGPTSVHSLDEDNFMV